MRALFFLAFFPVSLLVCAQSDSLSSTGNKDFDAFLAGMLAYEQRSPEVPLLPDRGQYRLAWTQRIDKQGQSVMQNTIEESLWTEDKKGRIVRLEALCFSSRYIGDRYYVCSYEEPTGPMQTTTWYYVRDSSIEAGYRNFLTEVEAYKQAPHPQDVFVPCEEYKLVWHYSNHSLIENVWRGSGEALCNWKKTEHLLNGDCRPQIIGDRYYIWIIDRPVNTIWKDVYYYERQPAKPEKKP